MLQKIFSLATFDRWVAVTFCPEKMKLFMGIFHARLRGLE